MNISRSSRLTFVTCATLLAACSGRLTVLTSSEGGITCGCVDSHIDWGMTGGFRVSDPDKSALEVCNLFVHQRPGFTQAPAMSCEQQISDCAGAIGPADVTRALAHPDVQAAVAAAPVLYGFDRRPSDGVVLDIQIRSAVVEVGSPCGDDNCTPIPPGVSLLAELLQSLTKQELSRPPCNGIFPPVP